MQRGQVGRSLLTVFILVIPSSSLWAGAGKEPWELTLEERLERRFDPKLNTPHKDSRGKSGVDVENNIVSVDGHRQPELLLPFELFRKLLKQAYGPHEESRSLYREELAPLLHSLDLGETFWTDLERISMDVLSVDREVRVLLERLAAVPEDRRQEIGQEIDRLQESYCADQARVLSEAESFFGRERLYKLLYKGVAKNGGITTKGVTPEQLKYIAGGCK